MKKRLTAPFIVDLNITSRCNLKCSFCYADALNHKDLNELSLIEIRELFNIFDDMNIHIVRLSGGEPSTRSDFLDILKLADTHNFATCINSNGTLLTDIMIDKLCESNLADIVISLDGPNPEIHDQSRGVKGAFSKTINSLQKLGKKCNERLSTTCTLTSLNCQVEVVHNIILLNRMLGIKSLGFQLASPVGRCSIEQELVPTQNQWENVLLFLTENKNKYSDINIMVNPTNESNVFFEYYFPLRRVNKLNLLKKVWEQDYESAVNNEYISCVAGNFSIAISSTGDVYPCELMMGNKILCVGNIRNKSFKEIWNESELLDSIHNKKKSELGGNCGKCKYDFCGGGCRAVAYACTNNLWESDIRCPIVFGGDEA
jgi:radical SAM protein with 4Fe4S-binding SPASM domain